MCMYVVHVDTAVLVQNGVEATRALRARGFDRLIIAITGNVMDDDVQEFTVAGADAVLAKPMMSDILHQVIKYVESHGNSTLTSQGLRLSFNANSWGKLRIT